MDIEDQRPIGAPVLAPRRRDRASVWVAEHRWSVPVIRIAGGLLLVAVVALVFRTELAWGEVIAFVIGAVLADRLGEHERERGEGLRDAPESLPREFRDQLVRPPATQSDGRYVRPGHM